MMGFRITLLTNTEDARWTVLDRLFVYLPPLFMCVCRYVRTLPT